MPKLLSDAEILTAGVQQLVDAYQKKRCTPSRAVEVFIAHQERLNPRLNLVTADRYAEARKEAAAADRKWKSDRVSAQQPLLGVPVSMKDSFHVGGMATQCGVDAERLMQRAPEAGALFREPQAQDGNLVAKLRAAGAIILNKSNTPTFCFCQESDSYGFGRANNPWNPAYTTGGSSGGEAALIAVGGAAAGFGSDIGGSIRFPAHFNGVVGFKSAAHSIADPGHLPGAASEAWQRMGVFGPITKSVSDAALMFAIAAKPELKFQPPARGKIAKDLHVLTFGDIPETKTRCTPETLAVLRRVQDWFREKNVSVSEERPAAIRQAADIWQLYMSEDGGAYIGGLAYPHAQKTSGNAQKPGPGLRRFLADFLKAKLGLRAHQHPYLSWGLMGTALFQPSAKQLTWMQAQLDAARAEIGQILGAGGLMLTPVYPSPAKAHGEVYSEIFHITKTFRRVLPFMALITNLGLPALSLPLGQSRDGMPIGLQLAALPGNEKLLFETALVLEKEFGGYHRCTAYD